MHARPFARPGRPVLALVALVVTGGGASFGAGGGVTGRPAPRDGVAKDAASEPSPASPAARPAPAQAPPAPPAPGSLGELVDLALTNNPFTRAVWHDARAAAAQAGGARSLYLP